MKITKDTVVAFHYALSAVGGEPIETTSQGEPMLYLHGHNNIFPVLEAALEGKSAGDELTVEIAPEDAYGLRQDNAEKRIPIKHLLTKGKLRKGMVVKVNTEQGPLDARIIKVGKFNVDIDMNHPLAGIPLAFNISIVSVREAEAEEIDRGHAHGPGGHQH